MANFIVIPLPPGNQQLSKVIPDKFGNACYCLENGDWLISYTGTSKQLSDELGISEGKQGHGVVLNVTSYWGNASNDIWEWLHEYSK